MSEKEDEMEAFFSLMGNIALVALCLLVAVIIMIFYA